MKFTIITSTYNCGKAILDTEKSLRNQNNNSFEWIVIDGKSNEDTIQAINSIRGSINYFITEKDEGIYDAWNKGCALIQGDFVIFLGAGDVLYDSTVLDTVKLVIEKNPDYLLYCGDVSVVDSDNEVLVDLLATSSSMKKNKLRTPPHPGVFTAASLLKVDKPFDSTYKIAADQKFMIPYIKEGKALMVDVKISKMDSGGISNNYKNIFQVEREMNRVKEETGMPAKTKEVISGYFIVLLKYIVHILFSPKQIKAMKKYIRITNIVS